MAVLSTEPPLLSSGYWQDLTSAQLRTVCAQRTVAVLPLAAVEQHGPHLPLGTDALINDGVLRRCIQQVSSDLSMLVLPAMNVGDSLEHSDFHGTLSIDSQVLMQSWLDIGRSVARAGVHKLVLFNSHGGQLPLVDLVAVRLRAEQAMLVARVNTFRLGVPDGSFSRDELAHGIHGGEVETSLMLHLHPELVRREQLRDFESLGADWATQDRLLGVEKPAGIGWMAQDLNAQGVCGNAAAADAVRGERLLEHLAQAVCQIVTELADTPLDVLRKGPLS
ncbi:MAG: creatinine amidohydrolase [Gammaproteobacteria bacterium]